MNIFFKILFKVITAFTNAILAPVNLLVANAFPDFSSLINSFNTLIEKYLGTGLSWFFSILPPHTQGFVKFYLGLLIVFYTVSISMHAILKVFQIIKQVKVW